MVLTCDPTEEVVIVSSTGSITSEGLRFSQRRHGDHRPFVDWGMFEHEEATMLGNSVSVRRSRSFCYLTAYRTRRIEFYMQHQNPELVMLTRCVASKHAKYMTRCLDEMEVVCFQGRSADVELPRPGARFEAATGG